MWRQSFDSITKDFLTCVQQTQKHKGKEIIINVSLIENFQDL